MKRTFILKEAGEEIEEMFRITEIYEDKKIVKIRLDGKIIDPCISDLEILCFHYRNKKNKTIILDFSGVTFINSEGICMLEKIKDERVKIVT